MKHKYLLIAGIVLIGLLFYHFIWSTQRLAGNTGGA